jgi:hypothetical protein
MSAENDHIGANPVCERTNDMRGVTDREMERHVAELEAGALHDLADCMLALEAF